MHYNLSMVTATTCGTMTRARCFNELPYASLVNDSIPDRRESTRNLATAKAPRAYKMTEKNSPWARMGDGIR